MNHPDPILAAMLRAGDRRAFLRQAAGVGGALALAGLRATRADAAVRLAAYPFTLGVASGDPTSSGVVLWTRLAPDPLAGGGMPARRVPVRWELSPDESFRRLVRGGEVLAVPELAHSVHVEVEGLEPARTYFYRFVYGGEVSPTGRTRTASAPGAGDAAMRFAFVSCQSYQAGYYTAHRHLANDDLELVVHLGDYIYEGGIERDAVRQHNSPEILTLEDYRNRYGLYKGDPDLQAAHAAHPFAVTWDDHEVDNDYADEVEPKGTPRAEFLLRRAAGYQAYYEHMPLRRAAMPTGPDLRLFRRIGYGDLLQLHLLDTRQYRTEQPCGGGIQANCSAAADPTRTLLGAEQERWLREELQGSRARWNVLGNQVPFAPLLRTRGDTVGYNMDKWDGATASRDRLAAFLRERRISNPVVITGDVHVNWLTEVHADPTDPDSPTVATEFVGTSVSSGGDGGPTTRDGEAMLQANPHMRYYNAQRGYVRCTVTRDRWQTEYRVVPQVRTPGAPIRTDATFVVEDGRPGVA